MKRSKKGFTLVELVIVIAVIAILSAILIPTFGNVLNDANRTAAALNAKNSLDAYQGELYDGYVVVLNQTARLYEGTEGVVVLNKDGTLSDGVPTEGFTASNVSYCFKFKSRSLNSSESKTYAEALVDMADIKGLFSADTTRRATVDIDVNDNNSGATITWGGAIMLDGEFKYDGTRGYLEGSIFLLYNPTTTPATTPTTGA